MMLPIILCSVLQVLLSQHAPVLLVHHEEQTVTFTIDSNSTHFNITRLEEEHWVKNSYSTEIQPATNDSTQIQPGTNESRSNDLHEKMASDEAIEQKKTSSCLSPYSFPNLPGAFIETTESCKPPGVECSRPCNEKYSSDGICGKGSDDQCVCYCWILKK